MRSAGLDYEVWYNYGEFDRRKVATFWLYHDARAYIENRENRERFTLVDIAFDSVETVKDW